MAFDRKSLADRTALKDEFELDPLAIGYAATNGATKELLDLINTRTANTGAETDSRELTVGMLLSLIDFDDLKLSNLRDGNIRYIESFLQRDLDLNIEPWRDRIRAAFGLGSGTTVNIDGESRRLSRAEVLWGKGTVIAKQDVFAMRRDQ